MCNVEWYKTYYRGFDHYARSITPAAENGYLISTYDRYPYVVTWVIRIDSFGDSLWSKYIGLDPTYTDTLAAANFNMVVRAPGGGYYFAGSGYGMAWVLHTDEDCNEIWAYMVDPTPNTELFLSCKATPDGGCFAAGQTLLPSGYSDIFAARCDRFGGEYYGVEESPSPKPENLALSVYPNPFNSAVRIFVGDERARPAQIEIYDIAGKKVAEIPLAESARQREAQKNRQCRWQPAPSVPSGVYLIKEKTSGESVKVVYMK
jgi:hypothetical protein